MFLFLLPLLPLNRYITPGWCILIPFRLLSSHWHGLYLHSILGSTLLWLSLLSIHNMTNWTGSTLWLPQLVCFLEWAICGCIYRCILYLSVTKENNSVELSDSNSKRWGNYEQRLMGKTSFTITVCMWHQKPSGWKKPQSIHPTALWLCMSGNQRLLNP